MYCKECGAEINDKAVVCVKCGCATNNPQVNTYNIASRKISGYGFHSTGRASRTTYWISQLILLALTIALFVIGGLVIGNSMNNLFYDSYYYDDLYFASTAETYETIGIFSIILFIFMIIAAVYNILLTIRRLHDTGSTGWLTLLLLIPYLGFIAWIVFGCLPSEAGANKYGTQPDVIE